MADAKVDRDESLRWYWDERVALRDDPRSARVNGRLYTIGDEHRETERSFRGFGGADFYIRFVDDMYIHTTNLWQNGDIPEAYRDQLFENAEFISKEEFEASVASTAVRGELVLGKRFVASKDRNPDLPSSGEVARDDTPYAAERGQEHEHDKDRGR